ncbi:MAG TPA: aldehyde dehydrogenase family protein [Chloroflexi bacterium]|nr:aldehyde dehydrogenase family protein [Chloroflexota bacterium]
MALKMKITYATMSADNEELQSAFDEAFEKVKASMLGVEVPMYIDGEKVYADEKSIAYSPIDTRIHLCTAQKGTREHARAAVAAAKAAFKGWAATPWQERVAIMRRIAEKISENSLELSAIMVMEVGKSRLEALGEVEETADLLRYYANAMEKNEGYIRELGKLSDHETNLSVLKPFGVWVVISPFNFPMALSGAPICAALITGNTVVFKGASSTLYTGWKTAELFAEAGLPDGVFNYVSGPGRTVGQELQDNPDIAGWTFTGSYEVGMQVARNALNGRYPKPAIIEMGGKNPVLVSRHADLDKAATGVARSAFGLDGQKCSACSRVYVEEKVYDQFLALLLEKTAALKVGNPTARDAFMGTVIDKGAYEDYQRYMEIARRDGQVLFGGNPITEGDFSRGYYVQPAIITGLPDDHELVKNELFLPILYVTKVKNLEEGMAKANDTVYGLTAGFFSEDKAEVKWFFDNIEAGTTYANRRSGATTGAWPGVQAFGGWKGSGMSGKGVGGLYTLPLYMHEQSQTVIE